MSCAVDGCDKPIEPRGDGLHCAGHRKRIARTGKAGGALADKSMSPRDRLREAALRYADAEDDEDFAAADENLKRQSNAFTWQTQVRRLQEALAVFRASGGRTGPAGAVETEQAVRAVEEHGSLVEAARALGVSRYTLRRALRRAGFGRNPPLSAPGPDGEGG